MRDEAGPGVGRCGCAPSDASAVEGAAIEWQERGTRRPPPPLVLTGHVSSHPTVLERGTRRTR